MAQREREQRPERDATPAEFKALAHPLRLRILRLCLHQELTNKELADRLHHEPATVLHHVRTLCRVGFLEAGTIRNGRRGALEKPYRSTGKSWLLSLAHPDDRLTSVIATIDALRAEVIEAGPDSIRRNSRLGLRLSGAEADQLAARIEDLVQRFAERDPTPGGDRYGLFVSLHLLDRPDPSLVERSPE